MPPDILELTDQISLTPSQAVGIPLALIGAVLLSLGAQFQHRGVARMEKFHGTEASSGLNFGQIRALLARPSWVLGTTFLGLAIVFQLSSLAIAPIMVVQPLGAVALVMTAIMNSRLTKIRLDAISIRAIVMCVAGVGAFVAMAATFAKSTRVTERELSIVLIVLVIVLALWITLFVIFRKNASPVFYILGAGMLFGFVATLAKVVIDRIKTIMIFGSGLESTDLLTALCIVGLIAASLLGSYFVQTAYASGPPDLVVAGLTVVDPLVAVSVGIIVLGEASNAPMWAVVAFVISGAVAIWGVFLLAKHHPQLKS
ncbi:DMT family transporter [Salinibacterium sp. M195]|uniref:DMT family transporter n=1 Tax=Salinibacterium sp. M195 TaxID=2583374 RepID=UPI001C6254AC|nr:DMT family transporter [Salinibacterium sp. M195]QYH35983.1 multidrug DMT transporter permease [Salinibacterium sp. M195]